MRLNLRSAIAFVAMLSLAACATTSTDTTADDGPVPFASTYTPRPSTPTLIRNATVFDGNGAELANSDVLMRDGRIVAVGQNLSADGATVIDGTGKFVTPGIIDAHSHLGVYPSPSIEATSDGNELTQPNTAEVWAEHSVWPQDPGFLRAVAGGITTLHVLPGSGNLFGGRGVTLRPVLGATTVQEMKFPGAPQSLKMACGENPSRVYGSRNQSPATGMGNVAGYRQAFADATRYARRVEAAANGEGDPPDRDLEMETLAGVLSGDIILQWHCYRADEMANAIQVAHEFHFEIAAFHHAVEAYKIADLLREEGICSAMWADWWGFKLEAYDGIRENIAFVDAAGACAIVHSDSEVGIQRLNQEAAKAMADGRRAGIEITRAQAWTWLSRNPARALHIQDETGTLEPGRRADVVIWSADPLSSYAVAERVFIDGAVMYERGAERDPPSDFELGQTYSRERAQ
ncbi:MAG: amidohydrolase [Alphaproteobacteria bacterium]|nr:amidohydrolase [Alphaproteobacteria bacterium]